MTNNDMDDEKTGQLFYISIRDYLLILELFSKLHHDNGNNMIIYLHKYLKFFIILYKP